MISSGRLGATIDYYGNSEFGELVKHFNVMSTDIKEGYEKIQKEIEERKTSEEALVKSEKFLNMIFDSIRDPFCIFDRDYKIVRANHAYTRLKRKKPDELYGARCYEAIYGIDSKCKNCILDKTFRSQDPCAKDDKSVAGYLYLSNLR